jgi:hypothetical protein
MSTCSSYGAVTPNRQAEIFKNLGALDEHEMAPIDLAHLSRLLQTFASRLLAASNPDIKDQ